MLRPVNRYIPPASLLLTALALSIPLTANAYVGPGAGLSLLSALWGLVAAIGVAAMFIILWPIRRMRRRYKARLAQQQATAQSSQDSESSVHHSDSPRHPDH